MLGKNFSIQHFEIFFFLFCQENRILHFMQIVSSGDNLHEMSNHVSGKNKKNIKNLSFAEFAHSVLNVK